MGGDADVKVAVLEEQIRGLREQQRKDAENTRILFEKLFDKIEEIEAALNRGKGAFAASLAISGLVGAALTAFLEWASHK